MTDLGESRLVIFDSKLRQNFYPFSLTRPVFDFLLGSETILQGIEQRSGRPATDLIVPKSLEELCRENHLGAKINEDVAEPCIAISSLVNPDLDIRKCIRDAMSELHGNFVLTENGEPVIGCFETLNMQALTSAFEGGMGIIRKELQAGVKGILRYPWEFLSATKPLIERELEKRKKNDLPGKISSKVHVIGEKAWISSKSTLEDFVAIDSSRGPVIIDEGAVIRDFVRVEGPSYIGKQTIINSFSTLASSTVGSNCRIGGEVEHSIVSDFSNKAHSGFLGHSIVGSWVNLGASTNVSDLKNTYGAVKMTIGKETVNTGLIKFGSLIGDMSKSAIGTLIYSGTVIGVSSHIFGEVAEDVPSFTMYRKSPQSEPVELYVESALETQRRMMERRGVPLTSAYSDMMKSVHQTTEKDRSSKNVHRGKFTFS